MSSVQAGADSLTYPDTHLHGVMINTVRAAGKRPALTLGQRTLTFEQFDAESNRFANAFKSLGISPGDRLALYLPSCIEYEVAFYGALKIGAVICPLNP